MAAPAYVLVALLSLAPVLVFGYVARWHARLRVAPEDAMAKTGWVVWWSGLALSSLLHGARYALAAVGVMDLAAFTLLYEVGVWAMLLAPWGLLTYVLHIYTARPAYLRVVAASYGAAILATAYLLRRYPPTGIDAGAWRVDLVHTMPDAAAAALIVPFVALPAIGSLVGYGLLVRRAAAGAQRRRASLVAAGLTVWLAGSAAIGMADLAGTPGGLFAERLLVVALAAFVLAAYAPASRTEERATPSAS